MTNEKKRALADTSNKLLGAVRKVRDLEERKRQHRISTPVFHELAEEVNRASQEVFRLARDEDRLGDESPRGSETIEDVDRRRETGQARP
jgi:hypothetical protein